jgi:hypothetical protein
VHAGRARRRRKVDAREDGAGDALSRLDGRGGWWVHRRLLDR